MYIKDPTKHNTSTLSLPESCRELYPPAWFVSACDTPGNNTSNYIKNWWNIDYTSREINDWWRESGHRFEGYYFRYYTTAVQSWIDNWWSLYGLRSDRFNSWVWGDLAWKNGMIFVR
jgi:hypothetical protein